MNSLGSAGVNSIMFVASDSVGIETDPGWWKSEISGFSFGGVYVF